MVRKGRNSPKECVVECKSMKKVKLKMKSLIFNKSIFCFSYKN
jgi:hypothetical protein